MNSAFQAPYWQSKFAFPLGFYIEFYISIPLLALEIRISAIIYIEFSIQAPCWQSKFVFLLEFYNELCISSPLLAIETLIPAGVLY